MSGLSARDDVAAPATLTFGPILLRFTASGALAGALAGVWSLLVTERAIAPALALEEARSEGGAHEEVFSRGVQLTGGVLGSIVAGVVVGLLFAAVFAAVRHRLPARTDFGRSAVLGAIGFGVFALLPAVAIPANPPAVGDPGTIGRRTAIYGGVLAAGLVIVLLTSALVSVLDSRGVDRPLTVIAAVLAAGILVGLVVVLFPKNPDAIPDDVPASVIWNFRLASLGQLTVLWTTVALVGGALVDPLTPRPPDLLGKRSAAPMERVSAWGPRSPARRTRAGRGCAHRRRARRRSARLRRPGRGRSRRDPTSSTTPGAPPAAGPPAQP